MNDFNHSQRSKELIANDEWSEQIMREELAERHKVNRRAFARSVVAIILSLIVLLLSLLHLFVRW